LRSWSIRRGKLDCENDAAKFARSDDAQDVLTVAAAKFVEWAPDSLDSEGRTIRRVNSDGLEYHGHKATV
jgi:hypothetical protein